MRSLFKVLLVVLALPVLVLVAGFVHGLILGVGGGARPADGGAAEDPSGPSVQAPLTPDAEAPPARSAGAPVPEGPQYTNPDSDEPRDAEQVQTWLATRGLLRVVDGAVVPDHDGFAAQDPERMARMHAVLRRAGSERRAVRLMLFTGCADLPPEARRRFAMEAGAVLHPPGGPSGRGYTGELQGLLHGMGDPNGPLYQRALRRYCEVLESDEVLLALRDFGTFVEEPTEGIWRLHVERTLGACEPETLMALHDAIDPGLGFGDRRYLRQALARLADGRRSD